MNRGITSIAAVSVVLVRVYPKKTEPHLRLCALVFDLNYYLVEPNKS